MWYFKVMTPSETDHCPLHALGMPPHRTPDKTPSQRHNPGSNDRRRHAENGRKNRAASNTNGSTPIPLGVAWRPVATDLPQVAVSLRKQTGDGSDKKRLIVNNQARNVCCQLCGLSCLQYCTVSSVCFCVTRTITTAADGVRRANRSTDNCIPNLGTNLIPKLAPTTTKFTIHFELL